MYVERSNNMEDLQITMTIIPKKKPVQVLQDGTIIKKRVAAYARVSTDLDDQRNSYEAQLSEYERRIKENPNWTFVKLYSDKGISGTSLKHREGFNQMIKDAINGKIDLILVKSISRWARNTVDCVSTYRKLKAANVGIYFDKEHINSLEKDVEFQLTLFASMAQEESRSISQNVIWGVRSRMKRGARKMNVKYTLGYEYLDEEIVINEEEAEIVRNIYDAFIAGDSLTEIAERLKKENKIKKEAKTEWSYHDVYKILRDEKYIGTFIMQKTVVKDFLDHRAYRNDGIEEKYILENHHHSIIEKDKFDYVQTLLSMETRKDNNVVNPFNGILFCGDCFLPMKKLTHHPGMDYARKVLTCRNVSTKNEAFKKCSHSFGPTDYELAILAAKDIFTNFALKNINFASDFNGFIEKSISEIHQEKMETESKIKELQNKLQDLVKQTISTSGKENGLAFSRINHELNNMKIRINELNKQYVELMSSSKYSKDLNNFSIDGTISNRLMKKLFKLVIRKSDGSLRFVVSEDALTPDKKTIETIKTMEPIYSSSVSDTIRTLSFDLVKIGGDNNAN